MLNLQWHAPRTRQLPKAVLAVLRQRRIVAVGQLLAAGDVSRLTALKSEKHAAACQHLFVELWRLVVVLLVSGGQACEFLKVDFANRACGGMIWSLSWVPGRIFGVVCLRDVSWSH